MQMQSQNLFDLTITHQQDALITNVNNGLDLKQRTMVVKIDNFFKQSKVSRSSWSCKGLK